MRVELLSTLILLCIADCSESCFFLGATPPWLREDDDNDIDSQV